MYSNTFVQVRWEKVLFVGCQTIEKRVKLLLCNVIRWQRLKERKRDLVKCGDMKSDAIGILDS